MIRTTVLLRALALLGALALPAAAQDGGARPGSGEPAPGEAPSPRPGGRGDWARGAVDFLADELDLDAAQREKVAGIMSQVMRDAMRRMAEAWGDDGVDQEKMRRSMEDMRIEVSRQIQEVLTPAQRREFEVLVEQFDRRAQRWEQSRQVRDDMTAIFDPPPLSKHLLMAKTERALGLAGEEWLVVSVLVEEVVDRRIALQEGRRIRRHDLKNALEGGASEAEVRQRLLEIRSAEQLERLELIAAQQRLRELLTVDQETRLVTMEVLD